MSRFRFNVICITILVNLIFTAINIIMNMRQENMLVLM